MKKSLIFFALMIVFGLVFYSPSFFTIVRADIVTDNLVGDPGFETSMSNFEPNQNGTSASLTSDSPINGSRSLLINTSGYGDSVLWSVSNLLNFSSKRFSQFTGSVRIRATVDSASGIRFCGLVEYTNGQYIIECSEVSGSMGYKGTVSVTFPLDISQDIERVRVGIFQEGSDRLTGVMIDDVSVVLSGGTSTTPTPTPEPTPTPILVNGVCGSVNGTTVSSIPTTNLFSTGASSSVSGSGPWNWTCVGINGGTSASCSAQKTEPLPPAPTATGVNLLEDSGFENSLS